MEEPRSRPLYRVEAKTRFLKENSKFCENLVLHVNSENGFQLHSFGIFAKRKMFSSKRFIIEPRVTSILFDVFEQGDKISSNLTVCLRVNIVR